MYRLSICYSRLVCVSDCRSNKHCFADTRSTMGGAGLVSGPKRYSPLDDLNVQKPIHLYSA